MLHAESHLAGPSYDAPCDSAGLPIAISLFADRPHVRAAMHEEAELAGLRIMQTQALAALEGGAASGLGDIVLVDAPAIDASALAMLERLDTRVVRSGARLVVATTIGALESVIVATRASDPVLLVEPNMAERLVALGEALAGLASGRVRELSEDDRVAVMRLVERVSMLAGKLDGLIGDGGDDAGAGAFAFSTGARIEASDQVVDEGGALASGTPGLPDPRRVRAAIRKRQMRSRFFDCRLFADPAWDILLDLTAARAEGRRVSVTSLCIASGVPPTTALRWIGQMTEQGLLLREEDPVDRRRAYVGLTDSAVEAMACYFEATGSCGCAGV